MIFKYCKQIFPFFYARIKIGSQLIPIKYFIYRIFYHLKVTQNIFDFYNQRGKLISIKWL